MTSMRDQFIKSGSEHIPSVPDRGRYGDKKKYPFTSMSRGDYSKISFDCGYDVQIAQRCANVNSGRRKDVKFVTRITKERNLFTLEVWCVDNKPT